MQGSVHDVTLYGMVPATIDAYFPKGWLVPAEAAYNRHVTNQQYLYRLLPRVESHVGPDHTERSPNLTAARLPASRSVKDSVRISPVPIPACFKSMTPAYGAISVRITVARGAF